MRIAYLILAHDHPLQLRRLTHTLHDFDDRIFIHINKQSNIQLFSEVAQQPHVSIIPNRVSVHWGGFSMVNAMLNLLREARAHPTPFDYYCLLSGSDYPIRSNEYIHLYLKNHNDYEFINIVDANRKEKMHLLPRLQYFVFERGLTRHTLFNTLLFQYNYKILRASFLKRNYQKYLSGMKPYIGDAWWVLSERAIDYIFKFMERHPKTVNFYRHTTHPLEMFFHTILGNSPLADQVMDNVTYTHWLPKADSPSVITDDHIDYLETRLSQTASESERKELLFARKFAPASQALMDRIDADFRGIRVAVSHV